MAFRYRAVVAFDGTNFSGYQLQQNGVTVQGELERVLGEIAGPALRNLGKEMAPVRVNGCSRTDAGVHAKGMVVAFDLPCRIPLDGLRRGMNTRLPLSVRIMKVSRARADFNPQYEAKGKEYRYFLYNAPILPPHLAPFWGWHHRPLDVGAMRDAAGRFVGTHDMVSFAALPGRPIASTVRTIRSFEVRKSGPRITFIVRGDGFLYKQVRSMVGFLVRVGLGDEKPEAVTELLEKHPPRTARVPTATGRGLFLWKVFYGKGGGKDA